MKNCFFFIILLAGALAVGCRKQEPASGTGSAEATPPAPTQSTDAAAPAAVEPPTPGPIPLAADAGPTVVPGGADNSTTLAQLTRALRHHIARTHQLPANFEDFAAKSHLQAPAPPQGKKYAISGEWKVVLVNR